MKVTTTTILLSLLCFQSKAQVQDSFYIKGTSAYFQALYQRVNKPSSLSDHEQVTILLEWISSAQPDAVTLKRLKEKEEEKNKEGKDEKIKSKSKKK